MVFSFLCKVGSIIVGTLFPCFNTYKAGKRRDGPMQKFYSKYWAIFACLSSIEAIADVFYITSFIPGYEMIKLAFLLWTSTGGAHFVYDKVIYPFLKKHEKQIDETLSSAGRLAFTAAGSLFTKAVTTTFTTIGGPAAQLVSQMPTYVHRQVIRSLSVEETFEQPQVVYSSHVVKVEEMDDEDWGEYIPLGKHEETPRSFVSRRPQKAPETKATLRRSKRQQEKNRPSIASKGSGDEDEANSSDYVFNVGNDEFGTDNEESLRAKITQSKSKRGGLKGRGRGRSATTVHRGNDSS